MNLKIELSIQRYSYYGTIKIFEKYFKKVNILMFEEYIYEKDKFCEKISNILDLDKEEIKDFYIHPMKIKALLVNK